MDKELKDAMLNWYHKRTEKLYLLARNGKEDNADPEDIDLYNQIWHLRNTGRL